MAREQARLDFASEPLGERGTCIRLTREGVPASYGEVLRAWRDSADFCARFCAQLADAPWQAFFFETPPLRADTLERGFEFVLIDAPALARRRADPQAFAAQLAADALAVEFDNLGGDARLIVPTARGAEYAHLAAFSRSATAAQQHALWACAATAMLATLGTAPRWLSSSGLGVSWLHLRIDRRPKYYSHRPYRARDA